MVCHTEVTYIMWDKDMLRICQLTPINHSVMFFGQMYNTVKEGTVAQYGNIVCLQRGMCHIVDIVTHYL